MLIRMTVEVEAPDVFEGEPCLKPGALLAGEALLLMHSNELGTTLGKVRVLSVGDAQAPNDLAQRRP